MERITSADLFSGIGGNAYAFHSFSRATIYCDIDPAARENLKNVMRKGHIDTAPIAKDVTKIVIKEPVDMICASWPCQGNSSAGKRKGMEDARSGLIRNVAKLVETVGPSLVFLENVPGVLCNGSAEYIIDELVRMGYDVAWCILEATAFGFPHVRARFFLLASKSASMLRRCLHVSSTVELPRQESEPRRVVPKHNNMKDLVVRCGLLGNSVVPHCVLGAFNLLGDALVSKANVRASLIPISSTRFGLKRAGSGRLFVFKSISRLVGGRRTRPDSGRKAPRASFPELVFDPAAFVPRLEDGTVKPPSKLQSTELLSSPVRNRLWATPRRGQTNACNYLTARSVRDLHTQVRFEVRTENEDRAGCTNPVFVEWLMGYPVDYTKHV